MQEFWKNDRKCNLILKALKIFYAVFNPSNSVYIFLFSQLLKDPQVLFAGYKVPHPLEHKVVLRIQTTADYSPVDALNNAINDLMAEFSLLEERFKVFRFFFCLFEIKLKLYFFRHQFKSAKKVLIKFSKARSEALKNNVHRTEWIFYVLWLWIKINVKFFILNADSLFSTYIGLKVL